MKHNAKVKAHQNKTVAMTQIIQGGRGHWAVYYTSYQSVMIMFSYSLAYNFGDFHCILIGRLIKPLILCRGKFVYHNWGYTLIYRILSYPFSSLQIIIAATL